MSDTAAILLAVVLLGLNAFFVGAEFALISARRTEIEPKAEAGSRLAKITLGGMEHVSLMMAGAQLGITICSLGLGSIGEPAVAHVIEPLLHDLGVTEHLLHPIAFAIALLVVVYLHVVIGEMVPKNIALAGPDRAALVLAPILVGIVRVLRPAIAAVNWIANVVLRAAGVEPKDEVTSAFTRDEVAGLVEESHREGMLEHGEGQLLLDALQFEDRTARAVLLPLAELKTVPPEVTPEQVEALAAETGFSRFPVRAPDGSFRGYLHLKDLLGQRDDARGVSVPARTRRSLPTVRVNDRLRTVLSTMQRSRAHLARVEDVDGTLLGVVALEDVLEELVGEIRDESRRAAA
ncbi:hemolysin family protein [Patulibacter sp. SYSU D01012]|uniref:hemolysin family protein n=1 Tax=Patulibacter sp. SYSU D01012 TaxID=2817381 RepID=UPI001B3138ED|nr:hemolysin family protein [Patulibacter sp. SYSU D01012]